MRTLKLCAIVFSLSFIAPSYAENWPTKPFESVVVTSLPNGLKATTHTINDGKGHVRVESDFPGAGSKSTALMDYPKHESIILLEKQKTAFRTKLTTGYDDNTGTKTNGKDLGKKTINGHPCHGVLYEQGSTKTELWTGDDINSMVRTIMTSPQGKTEVELQSYSTHPSRAASLTIPSDYKVIAK